jgi:hypothetical protein
VTDRTGFGFNELHAEERGLLLGLSLQSAGDLALARLAGDRREMCRTAWQALLAGWIVEAQAPFPPGMERLHPSWLAEAIVREPVETWTALLCGLPGRQAVEPPLSEIHGDSAVATNGETWPSESVAELQRCVFGRLAPFFVGPAGPVGAGLCRLGCEELLVEIARRGSTLHQELCAEGDASLWAVAGRVPATLGRRWVKW